jgi:hypothetical protein
MSQQLHPLLKIIENALDTEENGNSYICWEGINGTLVVQSAAFELILRPEHITEPMTT